MTTYQLERSRPKAGVRAVPMIHHKRDRLPDLVKLSIGRYASSKREELLVEHIGSPTTCADIAREMFLVLSRSVLKPPRRNFLVTLECPLCKWYSARYFIEVRAVAD